ASTGYANASTGYANASTGNANASTGNANASTGNANASTGNANAHSTLLSNSIKHLCIYGSAIAEGNGSGFPLIPSPQAGRGDNAQLWRGGVLRV
ncbi:MAG: hypothetical protein ACYTX0_48325, partial [Nostoc sp.]